MSSILNTEKIHFPSNTKGLELESSLTSENKCILFVIN